jgi:DNA-directed RNA polymerase subunit M/transcription elongation factor TFIIS
MNTETTIAKCRCQTCNGHLEFDPAAAGETIACPHCGVDTQLYLPPVEATRIQHSAPLPAPMPSRLTPCPDCGHPISPTAHECPGCGHVTSNKPTRLGTFSLILLILGLLSFGWAIVHSLP